MGDRFSGLTGLRKESPNYRAIRRSYQRLVHPSRAGHPSYSQFGEDRLLLSLFRGRQGTYVDIGSGHPKRGSNTYGLYRGGWRGLTIDPIKRNVRAAQWHRRHDDQMHALCGSENGLMTLYEFDPYELSTLSTTRLEELAAQGHLPVDSYVVPMVTLAELNVNATPASPSLLAIDAEGWEMPVLLGNDWSKYLPALVCIEEWDSPLAGQTEIQRFLAALDYSLLAYVGLSSIYVHKSSGVI